jgi:hypothetical protein
MRMKKAILISVAALLVLAAPALGQQLGEQGTSTTSIDTFGILGKGIASLPSDPANFRIIKVGVAKVKVASNGSDVTVPIGVLWLDDQKYLIRDVVIDNGSVAGSLYLNGTLSGSISLMSVIKGDTEIWAGTLTAEGVTYNAYVLEAPRAMKKSEWRERVREYCYANATDGNCSAGIESFCESNPTSTRCLALFKAHCMNGNNMDDSRCREFMKGWCRDNPEATDCRLYAIQRSEKYCDSNPGTAVCNAIQKRLESFCETDSDNGKCRGFCQENPDKCRSVVRNLADFCLDNANHSECLQYCRNNTRACVKLAANAVNACVQNPNATECREYCSEHPVQCRLATAELSRFCIGNQNNTRCAEFCRSYPNACRKVTENAESFCSANNATAACQAICKRSPQGCMAAQPAAAVVEPKQGMGGK